MNMFDIKTCEDVLMINMFSSWSAALNLLTHSRLAQFIILDPINCFRTITVFQNSWHKTIYIGLIITAHIIHLLDYYHLIINT